MREEIKSNFFEMINAYKQLIKFNRDKIPKIYLSDDFFDNTIKNLNKNVYKGDLLISKYYNELESVGKFINKYNIDISCIKKSTINKINDHHRLKTLNKLCFKESEDETDDDNDETNDDNDETDDNNDETNDDNDETDDGNDETNDGNDETNDNNDESNDNYDETDDNNNNNNNEKDIKNNTGDHKTKERIIDNKNIGNNIMDDLHNVLKKAIISNNEELMNNTIKLMNTLLTTNQENKINTTVNQQNNINTVTTYVKTLDRIK